MARSLSPAPPSLAALTEGARWTRKEEGESGGAVWRLSWADRADAYLKYGADRVADAIAHEAARLRWLAERAPVPAVRLFACTPGEAWLLTDAVPGLTADALLTRDIATLPAVVRGCAALMRRMHALPVDDCPFDAGHRVRLADARRNVAAGLVDTDDFDDDHRGWTAAAMLAKAAALAPTAPERVVTHGDFSLGNILFDRSGAPTGLVDVGLAGAADPYQDIAILWNDLGALGAAAQAALLSELEIEKPDEPRLQFHRCLNELF